MNQPKHPGTLIKQALRGSKIRQWRVAKEAGVTAPYLSEILNGRHAFTPAVSLALERLGVGDADDWYSMYSRYALAKERAKQSSTSSQ